MSVPMSGPLDVVSAQQHLNNADMHLLRWRTAEDIPPRWRQMEGLSAGVSIDAAIDELTRLKATLVHDLLASYPADLCGHGVEACGRCAAAGETRRIYGVGDTAGCER